MKNKKVTTKTSKAKPNQNRNGKMHEFPFPQPKGIHFIRFVRLFVCSCHFFSIHFSFQFRVTFITIFIFLFVQTSVCVRVCVYICVLLWPFYRLSSSLNRNYPPALTVYFIFAILYTRSLTQNTFYLCECVFEF